jgi:hypothetical protein
MIRTAPKRSDYVHRVIGLSTRNGAGTKALGADSALGRIRLVCRQTARESNE